MKECQGEEDDLSASSLSKETARRSKSIRNRPCSRRRDVLPWVMESVRVRFAPSPTGMFHIGSARTALFNWLYARHTHGTFVLRIEDTDAARNKPEFCEVILQGLRWLGRNWDEGPQLGGGVKGERGPYFQSQRGSIYKQYIDRLLQDGKAYESDGAVKFRHPENAHCGERFDLWLKLRLIAPTKPTW